jgi:sialate O-acetylesterase
LLLLLPVLVFAIASCSKNEYAEVRPVVVDTATAPPVDTVKAKVFTVSNIFQSNMVLQRDKPFRVWGTTTPNVKVTVKTSWNGGQVTTIATSSGSWIANIPATPINTSPQTMTVSANGLPAKTFNNILIGDVWICSGQSNMVMPVDSVQPFYGFEGVVNYKAEIAAANYPQIRAMTVNTDFESNPSDTLKSYAKWSVCSPATAGGYSAVSYFFARKINTSLNIPIGILITAASGTSCEAWVSKETIAANQTLSAYYVKNNVNQLYNGMIYPLANLAIKGFIWYQGENNRADLPVSNYTLLNSSLITSWRTLFNQGQLPFYLVQMTPFAQNFFNTVPWGDDPTADDYAFFREAQANIRTTVPGTGIAVTLDVGQITYIHPQNKRPVGERLALLALHNDYGEAVACVGPQYDSFTQADNVATISFKPGTADGLSLSNTNPFGQYFFVAGTDHIFRQGQAVIAGSQIMVTAPPGTPLPIQAVRYAFTDFPMDCNIQNAGGLQMEPFRSDDWSN